MNHKVVSKAKKSDVKWDNYAFYIASIFVLMWSILGVTMLNANKSNIPSILTIPIVITYIGFTLYSQSKSENKNLFALSLFIISISLIFMYSLRSMHVMGWDIHVELYFAKLTTNTHLWDFHSDPHLYNSCLSITILPAILGCIMGFSEGIKFEMIFKVIYPVLFSVVPLILYYIYRTWLDDEYAYYASILFIANHTYLRELIGCARQEIAILLFVLLIFSLVKLSGGIKKKILVSLLAFGVVTSHYSTAYIALGTLFFGFLLALIVQKISISRNISLVDSKRGVIDLFTLVIFFILTISWVLILKYKAPLEVIKYSIFRVSHLISVIFFILAALILTLWLKREDILRGISLTTQKLQERPDQTLKTVSFFIIISFLLFSCGVYVLLGKCVHPALTSSLNRITVCISYSCILFLIGIGIVYNQLFEKNRNKRIPIDFTFIGCSYAFLVYFVLTNPNYTIERLHQQSLIFIAPFFILGSQFSIGFLKRVFPIPNCNSPKIANIIIIALLIFTLGMATGFISQLSGERIHVHMNDYNTAMAYDYSSAHVFMFDGEIAAVEWLLAENKENIPIYAGTIEGVKIAEYITNLKRIRVDTEVKDKDSYVYLDHTNTHFNKILAEITWGKNKYVPTNSILLHTSDKVYCSDDAWIVRTKNIRFNRGNRGY